VNIADSWPARAEALRDELVSVGKLSSPELQSAVLAVPRHVFVPQFYVRKPGGGWELLDREHEDTREKWWERVYTNTSLVTQIGDIANGGRDTTGATSSSSAPGLMTRMIEAIALGEGQRVLEIGTGTGWNAALMSRLVGDENVYSVDVDANLVSDARERLAEVGIFPTLVAADGMNGLAKHAPYKRIMATCAVSWVPWAWAEQVADGGLVLVDVKIHAAVGNLVLLQRIGERLEGRFDAGAATFMHMRTPAFESEWKPGPTRERTEATHRTTKSTAERVWENTPLWFLLHLQEPGRVDFGYSMDPESGGPGAVYFASPDGSWCEISPADGDQPRDVWEGGPRRLWASIEHVIEVWTRLGEPGWERLGLTVTSRDHVVWLDDPAGSVSWPLLVRPA
jgi:protein-L-isoaspartate O-methyltransferase